jgi:predicted RNase H-like nuclease (RuvC/YqgF family)
MTMIPYLIAQASTIETAFGNILVQYGAFAALLAIVGFMLFLTWRSSEDAKIRRELASIENTKENTQMRSLVNDLASKATVYSDDIAKLRESVAEERGARNLLSEQLSNERKERLDERETLKGLIRDVSDKLKSHEARIEELTIELNGKVEEIKTLRLERDLLNTQLKDRDVKVMSLEKDIEALQLSKQQLEQKVNEQAEQVKSLAKQLADLDKTIFDTPSKPMPAVTETTAVPTVTITHMDGVTLNRPTFEIKTETEEKEKPE